ncbi:MAG: HAD-IIIC family phosphatase [Flexilinea sp.]
MTEKLFHNGSSIEEPVFSKAFFTWEASDILSLVRKLNKQETRLQASHPNLHSLRIAVLGTCNTQYLTMILKPYLYAFGIKPLFYEGVYGSLQSDVLNPESDLYRFQPDVLIAIRQHRDIEAFPTLLSSVEAVYELAENTTQESGLFWNFFHEHSPAQVFLTNIAIPNRHILGGLEANIISSRNSYIRILNECWLRKKPPFVHMIDQEAIASDFGKDRWFDDSAWFISKQPFSLAALPSIALPLARQISALTGAVKKCLVLDLDNTLWGGIIGDDGLEGINLDPNNAIGEAFLDFQRTLKLYRERGILLAVCSKNDKTVAEQVFFEHPYCLLKLNDFSAFMANWNNKAENIRLIAKQLNIGLDSLVFFDDNPAEREIVRSMLPMVEVLSVPEDPARFSTVLDKAGCFDWLQLSGEDLSRAESYTAEQERNKLNENAADYGAYLKALEMESNIGRVSSFEIERFTQLINKTNQFNLRTIRYHEAEIDRLSKDESIYLMRGTLRDKFSNYGLISALILHKQPDNILFIETWVMSCRVFKRDLERALMNHIVIVAEKWNCRTVTGEYIPTAKNSFVSDLYQELGFVMTSDEPGIRRYSLNIESYVPCETKIRIIE